MGLVVPAVIKAVIFDYFGVLAVDNYWSIIHKFAHKNGDEVALHQAGQNVSAGRLSWSDFCKVIAEQMDESPEDVDKKFHELNLNKELAAYIYELKNKGLKVGLLSNASSEYLTPILIKSGLDKLFDAIVVSSDIGFTKPDTRAFRACIDSLNIEPEEAVMIDDLTSNVYGAEQAGLKAILFDNNEQLRKELSELLANTNN